MKTKIIISAIIVLCVAFHAELRAQTVHIKPNNGSLIAAVSSSSENHLAGFGGAWVHNQVSMVWMTADEGTLTENGLLKNHANNISASKSNPDNFIICGGMTADGYFALALPKGYRFTNYKMTLSNNVSATDWTKTFSEDTYSFAETNSGYDKDIVSTSLGKHNVNSTAEYTLQRTSVSKDDMGNVLYFRLKRNSGYAVVYAKYLEVTFECADPFNETIKPSSAIGDGVDCATTTMHTGRIDLGQITWSNGNNSDNWSFRYNMNNVTDLSADISLYDKDGIVEGTAVAGTATRKHIKADGDYFLLSNDTYYIETPTEAMAQGNTPRPIGYRITGAKVYYDYKNNSEASPKLGDDILITDGSDNYMDKDLYFTKIPTVWHTNTNGKIWTGDGTYLQVENTGSAWRPNYILKTVTTVGDATSFKLSNDKINYNPNLFTNRYITNDNGSAALTSGSSANASAVMPPTTPYTLTLYDKKGGMDEAVQTHVNADNSNGFLELTGLNNDAIKFEVAGLKDGNRARIYAELTLEALNPYVTEMNIISKNEGGTTVVRKYSTADFMLDNGQVEFEVPTNFANEEETATFYFDNLTKKNSDDTYGPLGSNGNSRYHFVHSDYYNLIGENLQGHRTEAANYDYTKKVRVDVTGNQPFKANNSDQFSIGVGESDWKGYFEKYRYSNAKYEKQGGAFEYIVLKDGENKDIYLMVCDETRYNIAPTTTPRHAFYAYYNTNLKMTRADYEPVFTYTKIYDNAMLENGYDPNPYYGLKINVKQGDEIMPDNKGYLLARQIKEGIESSLGKKNSPVDGKHILYIDASSLNSIPYEDEGMMKAVKDMIGDNAIIFFPKNTTSDLTNIATKTEANDFRALGNIILVDKKPFYTPYDIRVDAAFYTKYTRGLTNNNGKVVNSTLIVPFSVAIDENGTHTNRGDDSHSFTFYKMKSDNALSNPNAENNHDYEITGHFEAISGQSKAEPNKPYLVEMKETMNDDNTIFVIEQYGASIHKTPPVTSNNRSIIDGETPTGTLDGTGNVTFTNHGTLSGVQLPKTDGYFYFSKDRFVSSLNLGANYPHVYVMPFRTFYDYKGYTLNARYMNISFEENSETTGITDIPTEGKDDDFIISTAPGSITVTALRDTNVGVQAINGQTIANGNIKGGSSRTFNLPGGIYIVNGKKIAIRY